MAGNCFSKCPDPRKYEQDHPKLSLLDINGLELVGVYQPSVIYNRDGVDAGKLRRYCDSLSRCAMYMYGEDLSSYYDGKFKSYLELYGTKQNKKNTDIDVIVSEIENGIYRGSELDLYGCGLSDKELRRVIAALANNLRIASRIKQIYLDNNNLTLPPDTSMCENLRILTMSENEFFVFPDPREYERNHKNLATLVIEKNLEELISGNAFGFGNILNSSTKDNIKRHCDALIKTKFDKYGKDLTSHYNEKLEECIKCGDRLEKDRLERKIKFKL